MIPSSHPELKSFWRSSDEDYSYQMGLLDGSRHGYANHLQGGWGHPHLASLKEYEAGFREGTAFRTQRALDDMSERIARLTESA